MKKSIYSKVDKSSLFFLSIILVSSIFVFYPLFKTALFGDDWQLLWIANAFEKTSGTPLHTVAYSYLFEVLIFNLMSKVFGYNSLPYYVLSFILRLLVSLTLFWFLKERGMSKLSSFLGSLIFILSPIGLEATIMVRNFDSYLGMILLLFAINFLLKADNVKNYMFVVILSTAALLVNTIRSPGFFVIVCSILLIKTVLPKRYNKMRALGTLIFLILIFTVALKSYLFANQPSNISITIPQIWDFIYSILGNIGRSIIPHLSNELFPFLAVSVLFLIWKREYFFQKDLLTKILGVLEVITIGFISYKLSMENAVFGNSVLIGSFFFLNFMYLIITEFLRKDTKKLLNTLVVFALSFSFLLAPNLRQPSFHIDSTHRYIIYSALAVPILVSMSMQKILKADEVTKIAGFSAVFILIFGFTNSTRDYLNLHRNNHSNTYTKNVWEQLNMYFKKYNLKKSQKEIIFLTDTASYSKVNASVHFGFGFRAGLEHNIWKENQLPRAQLFWTEQALNDYLKDTADPVGSRYLIEIKDSNVEELSITEKQI